MLPAMRVAGSCRPPAVCGPKAAACPRLLPGDNSTGRTVSASAGGRGGRGGGGGWHDAPGGSRGSSRPPRSRDNQQQEQERRKHYYDSQPRRSSRALQGEDDDRQQQQQWGPPRRGGSSSSRGRPSPSSSDGRRSWRGDKRANDGDDDDGPGWWEVPREQRAAQQAAAAAAAGDLDLEPWQEEQLLLAAAGSKKKMQVQTLAANLGLDRSEVLAWVAAFRARPEQEQAQLLAPHAHKLQQQQAQWAAEAAAKQRASQEQQQQQLLQQLRKKQQQVYDPWGDLEEEDSSSSSSRTGRKATAALPFSEPNRDTGYVPFTERRGADLQQQPSAGAGGGNRRLPAEVLRTLEGVYSRSPWPSREVVAGLFDLHRLPREVALEWFEARRSMDGLPSNPRDAKRAGIRAAALLAGTAGASGAGDDGFGELMPLLPPSLAAQPGVAGGAQQPQQAPAVSRLTARELVALRSSLPSPKKFKGARLAEELGIKMGSQPDKQVEIGGLVLVARDGAAAWRGAWRRRRAVSGLPAQRLDFQAWFSG